jgi:hypothetical protein
LSAAAGRPFHPVETIALTAALVVLSVGIFVYALDLPLPVWPSL